MNVTTDLTTPHPHVSVHKHPTADFWYLEIWPNDRDGSEVVAFLADDLYTIFGLGEAIVKAARSQTP